MRQSNAATIRAMLWLIALVREIRHCHNYACELTINDVRDTLATGWSHHRVVFEATVHDMTIDCYFNSRPPTGPPRQ
jgi:hypothetical protein